MNKRSFLLSGLSAAALGASVPQPAAAQTQPASQTLRIVVATPPGGASDAAARLVGQFIGKRLGQAVVVENRPGGNGVPAMLAVLAAPADGQTLLWAQSSMAGMPLLVKSSPVRSLGEFVPVATVVHVVYGLLVNPKVPAATLADFSAHLKANPDRLNYGTGVLGEYMVTAHYLRAVGAKAVRVPYKGGTQVLPDLVSGELQFNIGPLAAAMPLVRSGKLRLLATLPDREEVVPGVPSMAAGGIATEGLPTWNGLVAAPGTPADVAARLSVEVNRALADPTVRSSLEAQGLRVAGGTPRQMADAIETATQTWRQFVRDYDIPQE